MENTVKPYLLSTSMLAAVALVPVAASAGGDAPAPAPAPVIQAAPAYDWTGGYAGVQFGYLRGDMDVQFQSPPAPAPWRGQPEPGGNAAGVYAGYNWQGAGAFVYGVEGELNWSNAGDCCAETVGGTPGSWRYEADINNTAALRLRAGYAAGQTMFYAAGGLAYANFDLRYIDSGGGLRDSFSDGRSGWTLGIGVEHAFANGWVGRIDYRYSDFGQETYNIDEGGGIYPATIDLTTSEIRLGVAMRF
jgi:outer membrane immunogenic protein